MKITVHLERDNKTLKLNFSGKTIADLCDHLKLNFETILVARKGEILTKDEKVSANDSIEILSVISGG
ncbi:MoaD/ThiS family protein [Candidatus Woesearchaeota archaeon]|nr:MoaD/ThiS family protein [Candidatus Woesearchaeota archaeon]